MTDQIRSGCELVSAGKIDAVHDRTAVGDARSNHRDPIAIRVAGAAEKAHPCQEQSSWLQRTQEMRR
jgi:hypothetical protein